MLSIIARASYLALHDTINHDGIEHAGYLAFVAMLSLFPFLVFFVAIVGFIGESELGALLVNLITNSEILPDNVKAALRPRINEIISGPPQGLLTIAIIGAIWTASSAVEGLKTILNRAYRVGTPPAYIWRRLMSIVQFLVITAIVILSMFVLIVFPAIWEKMRIVLDIKVTITDDPVWDYLRYSVTTVILFLAVSSLYFVLPNIKQRWRSVAPGAIIVVILWFLSGLILSAYLRNFDIVNLIYGSLAGIIAALLFFYLTAMIFIYGAEFNYRLEKAFGHSIEQKE